MVKQFLKFASQRRQQWLLEHPKPDQTKSEKTVEDRKEPVVATKDSK